MLFTLYTCEPMTQYILGHNILELTRVVTLSNISVRSNPLTWRTRPVGADVASMTHTATLSSTLSIILIPDDAIVYVTVDL